jgi:hypothetical protein
MSNYESLDTATRAPLRSVAERSQPHDGTIALEIMVLLWRNFVAPTGL